MNSKSHTILLVLIASLGGLLYGYDLGIISAALLYLGDCMTLSEEQTGLLASAIMIGALASSIVGGGLSDWLGRKKAMILFPFLRLHPAGNQRPDLGGNRGVLQMTSLLTSTRSCP